MSDVYVVEPISIGKQTEKLTAHTFHEGVRNPRGRYESGLVGGISSLYRAAIKILHETQEVKERSIGSPEPTIVGKGEVKNHPNA